MLVIILQYSIEHLTKISKDTEAANFVKSYICVILKTFGHDCLYTEIMWQIMWHLDCTQVDFISQIM
jgi:hypothetical protein